jgi:hypothetical protein
MSITAGVWEQRSEGHEDFPVSMSIAGMEILRPKRSACLRASRQQQVYQFSKPSQSNAHRNEKFAPK